LKIIRSGVNSILKSNIRKINSYFKEENRKKAAAVYYRDYQQKNPGNYFSTQCFDYYKCIFIHIPKTAGLSVAKTLFGNYASCHLDYDWFVKRFTQRTVDSYYKFTFVRNPWDRLASAYFFLKKGGINENDAAFSKKYLSDINSFEMFVMDWLTEEKTELYFHLKPQYAFITSCKNRNDIKVDFVGRYETLEAGFKTIAGKIGLADAKLLKVNAANKNEITCRDLYTTEMREKVAKIYAHDIRLFDYSF